MMENRTCVIQRQELTPPSFHLFFPVEPLIKNHFVGESEVVG